MLSNPSVAGLVNFTESATTYAGKDYARLTVNSAQTNVDAVVTPKGTGAFSLQQADGTAAGGNTRGAYAVDLSLSRTAATQVASGYSSFNTGINGTANATSSINLAQSGTASGNYSFNTGLYGIASGSSSVNCAQSGNSSGVSSVNVGYYGTVSGNYSFNAGNLGEATGLQSFNVGFYGKASGDNSVNTGHWGLAACYGENTYASGRTYGVAGSSQRREFVLRALTTDTNPVTATSDAGVAGTLNQLVLANNNSITAQLLVVAKKAGTATTSTAHFVVKLAATRGASAATTVIHGTPVVETLHNPDAVTLSITADTTNGAVSVAVATSAGGWQTTISVFAISTIKV